jgi:E3 ubiquitin-protein ligase BRE1
MCTSTMRLTLLQAFRKEAIYRRMRHYARELERAQSTIGDLEKRKNACEAGMAAMEACWNQVSLSRVGVWIRP